MAEWRSFFFRGLTVRFFRCMFFPVFESETFYMGRKS